MEFILDMQRRILVFGKSAMLGELTADLRVSPLLQVVECKTSDDLRELRPDVILVDAAEVTPEQFHKLTALCPAILSLDPESYQLTVLSSPHQANPIADMARVIGILSLILHQPA
jgi:hypothetical protein